MIDITAAAGAGVMPGVLGGAMLGSHFLIRVRAVVLRSVFLGVLFLLVGRLWSLAIKSSRPECL